MKKKILIYLISTLLFATTSFAAGSSGGNDSAGSDGPAPAGKYRLGYKEVERANKLAKKGKIEKAKIKYQKALKFLEEANSEDPGNPDILNYLGFTSRKLGDFKNSEIYYLLGLEIDPKHNGINEYLGELYFSTGRIELAKERLNVLKDCSCEEYQELKEIIEGTKESKY
tara:strand:- start:8 stop:517 length:510 start_codon:yes stop_codon:yes gene_type:complete